jgi:hypothetical protein
MKKITPIITIPPTIAPIIRGVFESDAGYGFGSGSGVPVPHIIFIDYVLPSQVEL